MKNFRWEYLLGTIFLIALVAVFYYFYVDTKKQLILKNVTTTQKLLHQVVDLAKQSKQHFDKEKFEYSLNSLMENSLLEGARLEYTSFEFNNDTIFVKVPAIDKSWQILDITTDVQMGRIMPLEDGRYQFFPSKNFDFKKPVPIKFQAIRGSFIRDFIFTLPLVFQVGQVNKKDLIEQSNYILYYNIKKPDISQELYQEFFQFFILMTTTLFILGIIIYLFYTRVQKPKLYNSIEQIDKYVINVLNKNFQKSDELSFHQKEIDSLIENISKLSNSFIQSVNELNISRDILEKKQYIDDLTGLPNKKSFEKDLKNMFVNNVMGYVIFLKIDNLGELTKQHGGDTINSLIENFAKLVEKFFMSHREFDAKLYRFFGAEFAMILYEEEAKKIEHILDQIIEKTQKLQDKYYFFDNNIYYGGSPFDKYGTIESILQSAKNEYQTAYSSKDYYHISDLSDQLEKNKELEKSVHDIIKREDFALQYVYDTYDFNPIPKLIMQEVTPMIIDMRTFEKLPIGVFISAAEKIDLASEFDKILIKKALSHIGMGEIEHKLAINLSVGSFTSMNFITWLNSIMNYEKGATQLVFVITAYNAAGHFEQYKRFVDTIVEFDAEVMLKRFDIDDFSLEQLERIRPHYLRIGRDYCSDIKRDTAKQHKIKQILLFAEKHDIKVLGDSVKNELDYQTLENLGFYGTSR